jgi:2-methylcitrate dehydratase PrpD
MVPKGDEAAEPRWANPFNYSYNVIGGAAAVGRVLGCDARTMGHVLGLGAYSSPVPSLAKVAELPRLTLSKYGMLGWQAWSACLAGLMAQAGMEGDDEALDGPSGWWRMVSAAWVDWDLLTGGLGEKWWILDTSFKLEPAGTWMRPALRALRTAMAEGGVRPEEIEAIHVHTRPLGERGSFHQTAPESYLDTQTSYYSLIAVAALGIPAERWHLPDVYASREVAAMIARIQMHGDQRTVQELSEQLRVSPFRARGCLTRVQVQTRDGVFESATRFDYGDPFEDETRITDARLDEKFRRFGAPAIGEGSQDVPRVVWGLEQDTTARQLIAAFCRKSP